MPEIGINVLDHKHDQLRTWLDNIKKKRGLDSTLTVKQIYDMLDFLDGLESKLDDVVIEAFNE